MAGAIFGASGHAARKRNGLLLPCIDSIAVTYTKEASLPVAEKMLFCALSRCEDPQSVVLDFCLSRFH